MARALAFTLNVVACACLLYVGSAVRPMASDKVEEKSRSLGEEPGATGDPQVTHVVSGGGGSPQVDVNVHVTVNAPSVPVTVPGHASLGSSSVYPVQAADDGRCRDILEKVKVLIKAHVTHEKDAGGEESEDEEGALLDIEAGTKGEDVLQIIEDALGLEEFEDGLEAGQTITVEGLKSLVKCINGTEPDLDESSADEDGDTIVQGDMLEPPGGGGTEGLPEGSGAHNSAEGHGDPQTSALLQFRAAIAAGSRWAGALWANNEVRYCYREGTTWQAKYAFEEAIEHIESRTCVKFIKIGHLDEKHCEDVGGSSSLVVQSHDSGRCYSYVGDVGVGHNKLNIGTGCWHKAIAAHEAGHALGMTHEQSRPDRAEYVTIQWDNIKKGVEHNFELEKSAYAGDSYDVDSLMHYGSHDFAIDRSKPTITTKDAADQEVIGQRMGFSDQDVVQMNRMYPCTRDMSPIDGSEGWLSCWYKSMHRCHKNKCCCDSGYYYQMGTYKMGCKPY